VYDRRELFTIFKVDIFWLYKLEAKVLLYNKNTDYQLDLLRIQLIQLLWPNINNAYLTKKYIIALI